MCVDLHEFIYTNSVQKSEKDTGPIGTWDTSSYEFSYGCSFLNEPISAAKAITARLSLLPVLSKL